MLHVVVALARAGQAFPHIPQCEVLVRVSVSQPLDALPSQLPKPGLQVKLHIPALHVVVALARAGQAFPHIPQCEVFVRVSVSQPLDALPSQSAKPGLQVKPHLPALHVVAALARAGQVLPHIPQ
jgi:hypothetical protein